MNRELQRFEQIKATAELPSPKGAALTIVRLTQRDDVSAVQLEQAIKSDPAFVGRLLKAANAAGRNGGRPIAAVNDAIKVLGLGVVRNLALSFSLVSGYRNGSCKNFDFEKFWNRSLLTGLAFQEVARHVGAVSPEEAFCCGLLADVGRLALATMHPDGYSRLIEELGPSASPATVREREEAEFLLAHDDLSAALLTDWGLPRLLIQALYFRERPEASSCEPGSRSRRLLDAAIIADQVADICLLDDGRRSDRLGHLAEAAGSVIEDPDLLGKIVDNVAAEWREWGAMLHLKAGTLPAYAVLSSAAVANAASGSGIRVLLALADAVERSQIDGLLRGLGYVTFAVGDGEDALETALDAVPQVLIADAAMRGIDGVRLVRALRETRFGRAMYMLLLTEEGDEDRLVEAYDAGTDDYLLKPVKERVLAARLKAGTRVAELQAEVERDHREMKHFAAELAVTNRRLHEASVTDPLTGFYNRRYALERLEQEWAASNRSGKPLSCMMLDLDHFKEVNDTHGHDVGDRLLVEVSAALQRNLRTNDVICRIGGDEFLVISPDAGAAAIQACATRLVEAVGALRIELSTGSVLCGVSVGIATRHAETTTLAMLMKAADEGMYRAKIGGRHRVAQRCD